MSEKPTLNIVLVEPRIPQNTGNVARTCGVFEKFFILKKLVVIVKKLLIRSDQMCIRDRPCREICLQAELLPDLWSDLRRHDGSGCLGLHLSLIHISSNSTFLISKGLYRL